MSIDPDELQRQIPLDPYQRLERAAWIVAGFTLAASVFLWVLLLLFYGRA